MKFILLLGLLFSINLQAEERYFCEAKRYAGDNVANTIETCARDKRLTEAECARSVTCRVYNTHCESKRYAGDTPSAAASRCHTLGGYGEAECLRSVSCR